MLHLALFLPVSAADIQRRAGPARAIAVSGDVVVEARARAGGCALRAVDTAALQERWSVDCADLGTPAGAAVSDDGVLLWTERALVRFDVRTGARLADLTGPILVERGLAVSADGRTAAGVTLTGAATVGTDGTTQSWAGARADLESVTFVGDALTGAAGDQCVAWRTPTRPVRAKCPLPIRFVTTTERSPLGLVRSVTALEGPGWVRPYPEAPPELRVGEWTTPAFAATADRVVGRALGTVQLVERASGRLLAEAPTTWQGALALTPDGRVVATDIDGATVITDGLTVVGRVPAPGAPLYADVAAGVAASDLTISADGRWLGVTQRDAAWLWDLYALEPRRVAAGARPPQLAPEVQAGDDWTPSVPDDRFGPLGDPRDWRTLAWIDASSVLVQARGGRFAVARGAESWPLSKSTTSAVASAGHVAGADDGSITVFDAAGTALWSAPRGAAMARLLAVAPDGHSVVAKLSADGEAVLVTADGRVPLGDAVGASVGPRGEVAVWTASALRLVRADGAPIELGGTQLRDVEWHPTRPLLFALESGGAVRAVDARTGDLVARLEGSSPDAWFAAGRDGTYAVSRPCERWVVDARSNRPDLVAADLGAPPGPWSRALADAVAWRQAVEGAGGPLDVEVGPIDAEGRVRVSVEVAGAVLRADGVPVAAQAPGEFVVALRHGDNALSVSATGADGARTVWRRSVSLAGPANPRLFVAAVGGPAEDVADMFSSPLSVPYPVERLVLPDATTPAVRREIAAFLARSTPDDIVLLYIADARMSSADVLGLIRGAPARQRALVLDVSRPVEEALATQAMDLGAHVIAASSKGSSALVAALREGLLRRAADGNGDGVVAASELWRWVPERVEALTGAAPVTRAVPSFDPVLAAPIRRAWTVSGDGRVDGAPPAGVVSFAWSKLAQGGGSEFVWIDVPSGRRTAVPASLECGFLGRAGPAASVCVTTATRSLEVADRATGRARTIAPPDGARILAAAVGDDGSVAFVHAGAGGAALRVVGGADVPLPAGDPVDVAFVEGGIRVLMDDGAVVDVAGGVARGAGTAVPHGRLYAGGRWAADAEGLGDGRLRAVEIATQRAVEVPVEEHADVAITADGMAVITSSGRGTRILDLSTGRLGWLVPETFSAVVPYADGIVGIGYDGALAGFPIPAR